MTEDKRRAVRIDSLNLLYVGIYEKGELIKHAMGRTLNVSESGILLEMHFSIEKDQTISIALALEEDLVNVNGIVVYTRPGEDNKYEIGIQFQELDEDALKTVKEYVEMFNSQA